MSEKQSKTVSKEALIINEGVLKNKIYSIRGQKVMLDADLAEIYGYETKIFNRQVKNITEQGIYMLMTILRGELATKQSRALFF